MGITMTNSVVSKVANNIFHPIKDKTPVSQKVVKFTISANAANYGSSTTTLHFFKCGLILNQAGWVI